MNEERKRNRGQGIDLRDNKKPLMMKVLVPVLVSLALVASVLLFGQPVRAAPEKSQGVELAPQQIETEGPEARHYGAADECAFESVPPVLSAALADHGFGAGNLDLARGWLHILKLRDGGDCLEGK